MEGAESIEDGYFKEGTNKKGELLGGVEGN
jgi:hypothetical protein